MSPLIVAMSVVGWVFVAIVVLFVLVGLWIGLRSIPDARRYLRIRHM